MLTVMAGCTVSSMTLFSFLHFYTTVPPLSIHKEPDGIGRYMKELKPHLRLRIKTPFQLSGMAGCSQKGGKRGPSQHSSLDQSGTRSCIGRKNPAASLTGSRLGPFQQSNVTQEDFEMDLSALKDKMKIISCVKKKWGSWRLVSTCQHNYRGPLCWRPETVQWTLREIRIWQGCM